MLTHHHDNRDNDDYEGIYSKDGVSISNSQRSNAASWGWTAKPPVLCILFIVSIVIVVVVVIFIVSAVIFIILALKLG